MAQRAESKEPARNDASLPRITASQQTLLAVEIKYEKPAKPVLPRVSVARSEQPNEETHERRAAQAELKMAYDKCGPGTHGEHSCGTRLNTFMLAMRSTSRESSNHTHAARDLEVRGSNKKLCDAMEP